MKLIKWFIVLAIIAAYGSRLGAAESQSLLQVIQTLTPVEGKHLYGNTERLLHTSDAAKLEADLQAYQKKKGVDVKVFVAVAAITTSEIINETGKLVSGQLKPSKGTRRIVILTYFGYPKINQNHETLLQIQRGIHIECDPDLGLAQPIDLEKEVIHNWKTVNGHRRNWNLDCEDAIDIALDVVRSKIP